MNTVDWIILTLYLLGMVGLSAWLMRGQRTHRDYYLGGNRTPALPIALSTVATQCSTNSLLGAPAFVAFAAGGGLVWLQYELAVPFAMIVLMAFFFPVFRGLRLVSLYDYLERRFDVRVRIAVSLLFQIFRAFATGVTVYGVSLVLEAVLGIPYWVAVLLLGAVTIVYDVLGGMRAVIWSDVIQIVVLWGSILAAAFWAVHLVGGVDAVFGAIEPERMRALDFSSMGFDGNPYAFVPMLVGGLFLYVAYYGTDQTQAQRELATRDMQDTARALFYDGLIRFPLVLSYCFLGLCLAAWATVNPDFLAGLPLKNGSPNINLAVPAFVLEQFPPGLVGLVVAGLVAAAMSSLDSTLNALSALSSEDFVRRWKTLNPRADLLVSKGFTLFWGLACIGFSFTVDSLAPTVIESVNKVSSLMNGPLLAVFILGLATRTGNAAGAISALATGFAVNLAVSLLLPDVSWLWWNVTGSLSGLTAGIAVSLTTRPPAPERLEGTLTGADVADYNWGKYAAVLVAYGIGILAILFALTRIAG